MPSLKGPIVGTLAVPFVTFLVYIAAVGIEQGRRPDTTGRRAWMKQLGVAVAEVLGSRGTLIVGGLLTLAMVGWLFATLKARAAHRDALPGSGTTAQGSA